MHWPARFGRVAALVVAAALLGACAQESYDARRTVGDLVDAGLTREEATCVVREMNERISIERLGAREEPGDDEREKFGAILDDCLSAAGG
jgi:hypothetical protein